MQESTKEETHLSSFDIIISTHSSLLVALIGLGLRLTLIYHMQAIISLSIMYVQSS